MGGFLRERGGMEGGMSHVAAQRGTKTQEIKVEKQNGNAATEPKLLHFVTFIFFPCLWALLARRKRTARDFHPITVSSQPVCSVRENECAILKQWLGILRVCTAKASKEQLFPTEATFKHNTGCTSSAHNVFWWTEHLLQTWRWCVQVISSVTSTTTVLAMNPSFGPLNYPLKTNPVAWTEPRKV